MKFILPIFIISCNSNTNNNSDNPLIFKKEIKIKTLFPVNLIYQCVINSEVFFYYYDEKISKKLVIIEPNRFTTKYLVKLNNLEQLLPEGCESIEVANKDTIFILSSFTNKVIHLNFNGDVVKVYRFDSIIGNNNNLRNYYLRLNLSDKFYVDGTFYFHSERTSTTNESEKLNLEFLLNYYNAKINSDYIFCYNVYSQKYGFILQDWQKRFTPKNSITKTLPKYAVYKNHLYIISSGTDTMYIYSLRDKVSLKNNIKVKSEMFPELLHTFYLKLNATTYTKIQKWADSIEKNANYISSISINRLRGNIYLIIKKKYDYSEVNDYYNYQEILQIYDLSGKKKIEYLFDEKYNADHLLYKSKNEILVPFKHKYNTNIYEKNFGLFYIN